MAIVTLTQANFDEVTSTHDIVVIDFWAQWCKPCLSFHGVYETVSKRYADVVFGQVNIEEQPQLAEEFNVRTIPLLLIIRQQIVVGMESGAMPESALENLLEQARGLNMEEVLAQVPDDDPQT